MILPLAKADAGQGRRAGRQAWPAQTRQEAGPARGPHAGLTRAGEEQAAAVHRSGQRLPSPQAATATGGRGRLSRAWPGTGGWPWGRDGGLGGALGGSEARLTGVSGSQHAARTHPAPGGLRQARRKLAGRRRDGQTPSGGRQRRGWMRRRADIGRAESRRTG